MAMEEGLDKIIEECIPYKDRPVPDDLPHISNYVMTADLLPRDKGYRLPLVAVVQRLKACQYAPGVFAAAIKTLKDQIAKRSILIFPTGKIVAVACRGEDDARYACQLVRTMLEGIPVSLLQPDGTVKTVTLENRLIYRNCRVQNIVANRSIGCEIDMEALFDAASAHCKWTQDTFPGLEFKLWLTESQQCECSTTNEEDEVLPEDYRPKCQCMVTVLVFKKGKIVIIGAPSIVAANKVYMRMRSYITSSFRLGHVRIDPRQEDLGFVMPQQEEAEEEEMIIPRKKLCMQDAIHQVLSAPLFPAQVKYSTVPLNMAHGQTPLMVLAEAGRIEACMQLLAICPTEAHKRDEQGRTCRDRLLQIAAPSPAQLEILNFLRGV